MEEKDFDPRIIQIAEDYSYIIEGLLGHIWNMPLFAIDKEEKRTIELLKAQLIFFLTRCREIEND